MSLSPENLTWAETAPGVWQRGVDEAEEFYSVLVDLYEGSGRMFFAMTGHVALEVQAADERAVDEALRKAWLAVRHRHPTIASRVAWDAQRGEYRKTYRTVPTEQDREAWLKETLVSVHKGLTGNEWANTDPPAPGMPTLFVVCPPASEGASVVRRDLVLRSPHDIVDGIGTLNFLNNLIAYAEQAYGGGPAWSPPALDGSETANLSPPYRIAAAVPVLTASQEKRLAEIDAAKVAAAQEQDGLTFLTMPYTKGATLPGKHQRVALTIGAEKSAKLLAACKATGATVTQVFHAAIAMVVRDLQSSPEQQPTTGRYVNYILRNERASCRAPYSTPDHAVSVYHSISGPSLTVDLALPPPADRRAEFARVVQAMKDLYEQVRLDREHYILASAIFTQRMARLPGPRPPPGEHYPVPPPKAEPSVSISSMGRLDGVVVPDRGRWAAHNPWVTGEELGNGLGLFLGTFRGEVELSGAYNDAWHGKDEVLAFLKRCERVVEEGLGVVLV